MASAADFLKDKIMLYPRDWARLHEGKDLSEPVENLENDYSDDKYIQSSEAFEKMTSNDAIRYLTENKDLFVYVSSDPSDHRCWLATQANGALAKKDINKPGIPIEFENPAWLSSYLETAYFERVYRSMERDVRELTQNWIVGTTIKNNVAYLVIYQSQANMDKSPDNVGGIGQWEIECDGKYKILKIEPEGADGDECYKKLIQNEPWRSVDLGTKNNPRVFWLIEELTIPTIDIDNMESPDKYMVYRLDRHAAGDEYYAQTVKTVEAVKSTKLEWQASGTDYHVFLETPDGYESQRVEYWKSLLREGFIPIVYWSKENLKKFVRYIVDMNEANRNSETSSEQNK